MASHSQQESVNVGSGSSTGSGSVDSESSNPLWIFVKKIYKKGLLGGTWQFQCTYCDEIRCESYSRVRAHLLQIKGQGVSICKKVTQSQKCEMLKLEEEFAKRKHDSGPREVTLPCQSQQTDSSSKKRKPSTSPLARAFGVEVRDQLDQEIARMFYTGGLPFNLARNPHYLRSYTFAATHNIAGYKPPSYNQLRTTFLEQERKNVERQLEPLKSTWREKGVTIVTDGWSDPAKKPLINFMATSGTGPIFLKAVNCFGEVKDKFFIANLMKEAIAEVGHQNVVQIITDNAANCKAAGELIEMEFPHIYWTPCVVHTLNLALKNICAAKNVKGNEETYEVLKWISSVYDDVVLIKNFINNHSMRLSIFQKFSPLKLLSVAETRFASMIVMFRRFKLVKRGLEAMVISDDWSSYRDDNVEKASKVKEMIVGDWWWDVVDYIVAFTSPIYEMIRLCDTDKPCLHLVYEMWDSMIKKVKVEVYKEENRPLSESSQFFAEVNKILISRWSKSSTPLHCLAHSLNPRFYSTEWLLEDSSRVAPHRDGDISRERMKCFRRLFSLDIDHCKAQDEYALFSMKSGPFADLTCISRMYAMEPKSWWANFGAQTPLLQSLAFKILGQPTSSSCCERNWSTYSFIHSLRRNKLNPSRAQDLVYIHNNLRLLSRNSDEYEEEKTKMWDIGGDAFDSMDNVGFLEFAELSLDEPELESALLVED